MAKHKRNLFEELKQSIQEINDFKAGKITLRTHKIEKKLRPHVHVNAVFIVPFWEKNPALLARCFN